MRYFHLPCPDNPCWFTCLAGVNFGALLCQRGDQHCHLSGEPNTAPTSTFPYRHEADYLLHCSIIWSSSIPFHANCCSTWLHNILYRSRININAPNRQCCRSCTREPHPMEQPFLRIRRTVLFQHHHTSPSLPYLKIIPILELSASYITTKHHHCRP